MTTEKLYLTEKYINENINFYDGYADNVECYEEGGNVLIHINPTGTLEKVADKIRKDDGLLPLFGDEADPDEEGWYEFYVVAYKDRVDGLFVDPMFTQAGFEFGRDIPCTDDTNAALYGRMRKLFSDGSWERIWDMEA